MPFFGGFRSNSAKSRSKSATPASSSGISNGGYLPDSENDRQGPKPKSNSFKRFFISSTQPKKKKPAWDEDQHRRTSVARSDTFTMKQEEPQSNSRKTQSVPRDRWGRKQNGGGKKN